MAEQKGSVVVTGAAGGIGRATVERLARNGWQVVAVDRDADKLGWTKGVAHVVSFAGDVSSAEDNEKMMALAAESFGGLNAIILNAAIPMGGGIDQVSMEQLEQATRVNFFGPVLGVKAALPHLRKAGGGSIVITASMHGLTGESQNWAYVATKHAVVGLVKALARDHGWENIRVNALCPGLTRGTGMTSMIEEHAAEAYKVMGKKVPLQRWAEPDEMASVAEFLISPGASFISGVAVPVDGGTATGSGLSMPPEGPPGGFLPPM